MEDLWCRPSVQNDSSGFGAMEEGLTSRGDRNLRIPLRFGLRPQGSCRVGTGESGYVFSEEWNSACIYWMSGLLGTESIEMVVFEAPQLPPQPAINCISIERSTACYSDSEEGHLIQK